MKPLNFSANSWHYRLARFGDEFRQRDLSNICSYTRAVINGAFLCLLIVASGSVVTAVAAEGLTWVLVTILNQVWIEPDTFAVIFVFLMAIVLAVCITALIGYLWRCTSAAGRERLTDTFVANSYRSFKSRFCVPVRIMSDTGSDSGQ